MTPLLRMARLNTVPMGAGLVGLGAYGARATRVASPLLPARLALGSLLTVIVTTGSMLINDYHDHKLGVDNEATKPGRPLVTVRGGSAWDRNIGALRQARQARISLSFMCAGRGAA